MSRTRTVNTALICALMGILAACSETITDLGPAPATSPCPAGLPEGATCYTGAAPNGAEYLIAIPRNYDRTLIMYNRGSTGGPRTVATALGAGRVLMADGFAFAASNFRATLPLARDAAEDTENLRQLFVRTFGTPRRTVVYGNSYGGLVTAR